MPSTSKADKKAAVDAAAWMFNVVTSVGIIIVNKALMATYGFSFGKFLSCLYVEYSSLHDLCILFTFMVRVEISPDFYRHTNNIIISTTTDHSLVS